MTKSRITKALAEDKPARKQAPAVKPLPKSDAAKADLLYTTRATRLVLNKDVEALKATETQIKDYFINNFSVKDATGIAGKLGCVSIEPEEYVYVSDWDKLYAFIVKEYAAKKRNKSEAFLLLQKALASGVAKEMLDGGVKIPGVAKGITKKVSCTKV
jgi:hypothetical protein